MLSLDSFADASLAGSVGHDVAIDGTFGYRYFLEVTNDGNAPEDVTFDFQLHSAAILGGIDAPYDLATNSGA